MHLVIQPLKDVLDDTAQKIREICVIRDKTIPRPDAMLKALVEKNPIRLGVGIYHITSLCGGFAGLFER